MKRVVASKGRPCYSLPNADVSSRRVARCVGTTEAISATVTRTATVTMSVTRSNASVPHMVLQQATGRQCGGHAEHEPASHDPGAGPQEQSAYVR
jgi:hypothetical protein